MSDSSPFSVGLSGLGGGGVQPMANTFVRQHSYTERANQGALSAEQSGLQSVQDNFSDLSGGGISAQLTQLWQDWSNLASSPADQPMRAKVLEDGKSLTISLNQTYSALSGLSSQMVQEIDSTLQQVNQAASQIASFNRQVLAAGMGSAGVAKLQCQREQLISELSRQLGITVSYNADGTTNVYSGAEALVPGPTSVKLSLSGSGAPYSLIWSRGQSTHQPSSGSLAGMLEVVNAYVPQFQDGLDKVARSLIGSVNYLMSTGCGLNNEPGQPFFLGSGAADVEVNPAVAANAFLIAAASGPVASRSSATNENGTIAAEIGELPNSESVPIAMPAGGWANGSSATDWTTGATKTTGTEADFAYNQLVTSVAQATADVNNALGNQRAVANMDDAALQSVTGVNAGQEMTNMVMYQNAYDASAKFTSTVGSVLQSLMSMVNS